MILYPRASVRQEIDVILLLPQSISVPNDLSGSERLTVLNVTLDLLHHT